MRMLMFCIVLALAGCYQKPVQHPVGDVGAVSVDGHTYLISSKGGICHAQSCPCFPGAGSATNQWMPSFGLEGLP
jgi:hypothetical protein